MDVCATGDHQGSHLKMGERYKEDGNRGKEFMMVMSLEIISVLVRSYSETPGGSRSEGYIPGSRDSQDRKVSVPLLH